MAKAQDINMLESTESRFDTILSANSTLPVQTAAIEGVIGGLHELVPLERAVQPMVRQDPLHQQQKTFHRRYNKRYINRTVVKLLELFNSEDPQDRVYMKTILYKMYEKYIIHRPFIWKAINNIFFQFIYETESHNGIEELLEVMGSIIDGFAQPLKQEHKMFLVDVLLPLHKLRCVSVYHQQLSYCIVQFVKKDLSLGEVVIRGLVKYWPRTNSQKEVLFLGELMDVLEAAQGAQFQRYMVPLFRVISRCLSSCHFQVAKKALNLLLDNNLVVSLVEQNQHVVLPLIFAALERNTCTHWNQTVRNLSADVRKMFSDMDLGLS